MNKLTTEKFIEKASKKFNNYYDYSKVNYINSHIKITIIDPILGEFRCTPSNHLHNGIGHPLSNKESTNALDNNTFLNKVKKNNYPEYILFTKVNYKTNKSKIILIDTEFGEYIVRAQHMIDTVAKHPKRKILESNNNKHLNNIEHFINKSIEIHGNIHDFSKVFYINVDTKVTLIDHEYGEYKITPYSHLKNKVIHPQRKKHRNHQKLLNEFIIQSKKIFGDIYDYSKITDYHGLNTMITLIDKNHGEFSISAYNHIKNKNGHPKTRKITRRKNSKRKKSHYYEIDHIIPLSIICSFKNRIKCNITKNRPLFKFLDSDINKKLITKTENSLKSDKININGQVVRAISYRNNYSVIKQLLINYLKLSNDFVDELINNDINYLNEQH